MVKSRFSLMIVALALSACQANDFKLPEIEVPKLSLTRETPAPVENLAHSEYKEHPSQQIEKYLCSRATQSTT